MNCREPSISRIDCRDSQDALEETGYSDQSRPWLNEESSASGRRSDRQEYGYDARRDPHVRIGLSQETLEMLGPVSQLACLGGGARRLQRLRQRLGLPAS